MGGRLDAVIAQDWVKYRQKRQLDELTLVVTLAQHRHHCLILPCLSAFTKHPLNCLMCLPHWLDRYYETHPIYTHKALPFIYDEAIRYLPGAFREDNRATPHAIYTREPDSPTLTAKHGHSCKICRKLGIDLTLSGGSQ